MANDYWQTPESVLAPIRAFYGGAIDLDPCDGVGSRVGALNTFNEAQDGLAQVWYGKVFCNPPYSRGKLALWTEKAYASANSHEGEEPSAEVLMLIPVATSTKWWEAFVTQAQRILFYNKRIHYVGEKSGSPRFDSCLVYYGWRTSHADDYLFSLIFGDQGWIVTP